MAKKQIFLLIVAGVLIGFAFFGHYGYLDNSRFQKEYLDNIEKARNLENNREFGEAAVYYQKARQYLKNRKYYKDDNDEIINNLSVLIGNSYYNEAERQLKNFLKKEFEPNKESLGLGEIVKIYQQALEIYNGIPQGNWLVKFNKADATIMALAINKFLRKNLENLESEYALALKLFKEARSEYVCGTDDVCARDIIWNIEMLIKPSPPKINELPQNNGENQEGEDKNKQLSEKEILEGLGDLLAALGGANPNIKIEAEGLGLKGGLTGKKTARPSKRQPGATARGERPLGIK